MNQEANGRKRSQCNSTHHPNIHLKGPRKTNMARQVGIPAENKEGQSKIQVRGIKT